MDEHGHKSHAPDNGRLLFRALLLTLGFAAVEALAGWWSGSLALLSDAGHMLTDSSALGLAALAAALARRASSQRHTWGMGRAEVLAALVNALMMLAIVAGIVYSAFERLQTPQPVKGGAVMLVAALGLAVNLIVLRMLSRGGGHGHHGHDHGPAGAERNLNVRGAILHVVGDLLGSVAALGAGIVIYFTGWTPIDPLLSLAICVLILLSSLGLLREGLHVLMEGVPRHLDLDAVGKSMARTPGVAGVHDLHIWQVKSDQIALSAHVVLRDMQDWLRVLDSLNRSLARDYGIRHVTLQPEPLDEVRVPVPKIGPRAN
ncbi:MAG TPA: cation diffusion facilitator family transporter [Nevskiales bacterium]|nr:cation diffusion facilitator family transporter [Nevskiales bacterium]